MKIKIDMTRMTFGLLTVLHQDTAKIGNARGSFWICLCECGNTKSISRQSLVHSGTKSCGCLQKISAMNAAMPNAGADKKHWLRKYKLRAAELEIEFSLSDKEFYDICSLECYYCGDLPIPRNHGYKRKNDTGVYKANGIDRVEPRKGYTKENSVACCTPCNFMKTDKTMDDFIQRANKIANKHRTLNAQKG